VRGESETNSDKRPENSDGRGEGLQCALPVSELMNDGLKSSPQVAFAVRRVLMNHAYKLIHKHAHHHVFKRQA